MKARAAVAWQAACRGGALVHGASAVRRDRAYLFYGESGAGKSTLSACNRRATVVSDDLSLVLPAVTLGTALAAILSRMVRSSLLEVLGEDYIRTARAKGVPEAHVLYRHAFLNAFSGVIPVLGLQAGFVLSGAIYVEKVFQWPGLGRMVVDAIAARGLAQNPLGKLAASEDDLQIVWRCLVLGHPNDDLRHAVDDGVDQQAQAHLQLLHLQARAAIPLFRHELLRIGGPALHEGAAAEDGADQRRSLELVGMGKLQIMPWHRLVDGQIL